MLEVAVRVSGLLLMVVVSLLTADLIDLHSPQRTWAVFWQSQRRGWWQEWWFWWTRWRPPGPPCLRPVSGWRATGRFCLAECEILEKLLQRRQQENTTGKKTILLFIDLNSPLTQQVMSVVNMSDVKVTERRHTAKAKVSLAWLNAIQFYLYGQHHNYNCDFTVRTIPPFVSDWNVFMGVTNEFECSERVILFLMGFPHPTPHPPKADYRTTRSLCALCAILLTDKVE